MSDQFDFHAIEREARHEAAKGSETPLEYGQHLAWATTARGGVTDGLSPVHRVGVAKGNVLYTTCDIPVADPVLWLPLSPVLAERLTRCGHCEANFAEQTRGIAA